MTSNAFRYCKPANTSYLKLRFNVIERFEENKFRCLTMTEIRQKLEILKEVTSSIDTFPMLSIVIKWKSINQQSKKKIT